MNGTCLQWDGRTNDRGYAVTFDSDAGRDVLVHRVRYEQEHGSISGDHVLHHECENRACINPEHLVPMTRAEHALEHFRESDEHFNCGHPRSESNTYRYPSGDTQCRECRREATRKQREGVCPSCGQRFANLYNHKCRGAKITYEKAHPGTDWHDRRVQPLCNICGRFARWDNVRRRWVLGCTSWTPEGYEHD